MEERMERVFRDSLELPEDYEIKDNLKPNEISEWDSLANMNLISNLEEEFGIEFDFDSLMELECWGDIKKKVRCLIG